MGISKINVELSELKQMVKKAQEIDSILKAIEQLNQVIEDEESKEDLKGVKSAEEIQLELEKLNNQKFHSDFSYFLILLKIQNGIISRS